ncbi:MAG: asparaginase domain-containing protein [Alphaproteobacteria bacterium]
MKIITLFCGGTISMTAADDGTLSVINADKDHDFLYKLFAGFKKNSTLSKHEYLYTVLSRKDSARLTSQDREFFVRAIKEAVNTGADVIIIPHGTDSMSKSACAIAHAFFNHKTEKSALPIPVIFTGSVIPAYREVTDAIDNYTGAILSGIACREKNIGGSFLFFGDRLLLGTRTEKTSDTDFNAFHSTIQNRSSISHKYNEFFIGKIKKKKYVFSPHYTDYTTSFTPNEITEIRALPEAPSPYFVCGFDIFENDIVSRIGACFDIVNTEVDQPLKNFVEAGQNPNTILRIIKTYATGTVSENTVKAMQLSMRKFPVLTFLIPNTTDASANGSVYHAARDLQDAGGIALPSGYTLLSFLQKAASLIANGVAKDPQKFFRKLFVTAENNDFTPPHTEDEDALINQILQNAGMADFLKKIEAIENDLITYANQNPTSPHNSLRHRAETYLPAAISLNRFNIFDMKKEDL